MTGVMIYALMALSTGSLLLGGRLLDGTGIQVGIGLLVIAAGLALAALAIVGAWRPPSTRDADTRSTTK